MWTGWENWKEEIEGTVKKERHELKTKGKLIMESSLSALTLAAIIGASACTADFRHGKIEPSGRIYSVLLGERATKI